MSDEYLDKQEYIQSQYSNSPTIKRLLNDFRDNILPNADIKVFYDNVFNIETAQGIGLDIWGVILGISREISLNSTISKDPLFGFKGSEANPFNNGIFYDIENVETGKIIITNLDDGHYRELLLFKALANISSADMATLNKLTQKLYHDNDIIVTNVLTERTLPNGDKYNENPMRVSWIWRKNNITNLDRALFNKGAILCLSAGVDYSINVISKDPLFGFAGSRLNPFNNGAFGILRRITEDELNGTN